jgi:hypothetical protein
MSTRPLPSNSGTVAASPRLLGTALAGLLCLSTQACGSKASDTSSTPEITSSKEVDNLDAAGFKALCDARMGTVEEMAHCGGLATAPGFSYDITENMLSEHTCKGANTCAGWNCITTPK